MRDHPFFGEGEMALTGEATEMRGHKHIYLGYMECFSSCILTYLHMTGRDERIMLLDYWNLKYDRRTLLSSKDARHIALKYLYGIELQFEKGDTNRLIHWIRQGYSVIAFTTASGLDYFPRAYVTMESAGLNHAILIYGWNERQRTFLISDPVVHTWAELTLEQMLHAGMARTDREELHFFILSGDSSPVSSPDTNICLAYASNRNLKHYQATGNVNPDVNKPADKWSSISLLLQNRKIGINAWTCFGNDVKNSLDWTRSKRTAWVKQNNLSISSIKKIRSKIWGAYRELASLSDDAELTGQRHMNQIAAAWNHLNFLLLKYNNKPEDRSAMAALIKQIECLKELELRFLMWLDEAMRRGDANAS